MPCILLVGRNIKTQKLGLVKVGRLQNHSRGNYVSFYLFCKHSAGVGVFPNIPVTGQRAIRESSHDRLPSYMKFHNLTSSYHS